MDCIESTRMHLRMKSVDVIESFQSTGLIVRTIKIQRQRNICSGPRPVSSWDYHALDKSFLCLTLVFNLCLTKQIIWSMITRFWFEPSVMMRLSNEINLFGLARVEDECKTQKRFIELVIIPS